MRSTGSLRRPLARWSIVPAVWSVVIAQELLGFAPSAFGSCPDARFAPQVAVPAGGAVAGIASADFDGDGNPDLAVTNLSSIAGAASSVAILLGDGDGAFGAPTRFAAGHGTARIVASDFDADGRADVAALNGEDGTVSVFLGDGRGGLRPPGTFSAGGPASGMALGDLDGDGRDDLVVTNFEDARIVVLLARGDGSLSAPTPFPVGEQPVLVAVGDLDEDGNLDVVVDNFFDESVSVLLGQGDGTFGPQSIVPVPDGFGLRGLVVSDLDGDGFPDVAGANAIDDAVVVFPGRGDGSLERPTEFAVGGGPVFLVVGDLSGDGKPDLAAANVEDATVSVLLGDGNGAFGPQTTLSVGETPLPVAAGDFNRDGALDLVVGSLHDQTVSVLTNACTGSRPPIASAGPDQLLECTGDLHAIAELDGSASSDPDSTPGTNDDIASFDWSERGELLASGETVSVGFSLGTHDVSLTVTDRSDATGSDAARITVQDTIPPATLSIEANPRVLWPPNHRFVPVAITAVASDVCDAAPSCKIVSVTSDEPVVGPGGDANGPDWVIVEPGPEPSPARLAVLLRAERTGAGPGRTYTIGVSCEDAAGNETSGQTTVTVPRVRFRSAGAARSGARSRR